MSMATGLGVPVFIVVTKSDLAKPAIDSLGPLRSWLTTSMGKDLLEVGSDGDVNEAISQLILQKY
jgi:hypothetical protein